jgi:hypothetical protein
MSRQFVKSTALRLVARGHYPIFRRGSLFAIFEGKFPRRIPRLGYTTLEFKISFVRGTSETSGAIRTEGRVLNAGPHSTRVRKIMIVAVARKLAIALWRYVEHGLAPGATLNVPTTRRAR